MKRFVLWLLSLYKERLSPRMPVACRYTPTCSEYAMEAVARHGVIPGGALAFWRLLRCNPLGGRGLDQVPEKIGCRSHRLAGSR